MLLLTIFLFVTVINGQNVDTTTSAGYTNYVETSTDNCTGSASICTCGLPYNISNPPDVWLTANVTVPSIVLTVDNIQARLNLGVQAASLITLSAGVLVTISTVQLTIEGVNAQVQLAIKFDRIVEIVNDTLNALDASPALVLAIEAVKNTVGTIG